MIDEQLYDLEERSSGGPPSEGGEPGGPDASATRPPVMGQVVTGLVAGVPLVALVISVVWLWGHGIGWRDVALALVLYAITGHGIAIGFHRLLTHRSFRAARPLRMALAVAGSMAFEGGPIGWVADHRRHHAHTDRDGDPHSPQLHGRGLVGRLRGLGHAQLGWLFVHSPTSARRYASDLVDDPDMVVIDRLFPVWCAASLGLPFALGWALGGTIGAGLSALLWAGLVRVCLLQHVTWSVNSLCHMFGARPFRTRDQSSNVGPLALLSFGESWHNAHHAFPTLARLGVDRGQWDSSAVLIRGFERAGWAHEVRWPDPERCANRRIAPLR